MRRLLAGAAGAALIGLAAGCGGASAATSHPAPTVTVTATPAPTATDPNGELCSSLDTAGYCPGDDPATTAAPATSAPSGSAAFAAWYGGGTGTGYTDFTTVGTDLTTMQNDATAGDVAAAQTDGTQLAMDASTAAADPMPIDTGTYVTAMNQLTTAGDDTANGDYTDATASLQESAANMNAISATIKAMTP